MYITTYHSTFSIHLVMIGTGCLILLDGFKTPSGNISQTQRPPFEWSIDVDRRMSCRYPRWSLWISRPCRSLTLLRRRVQCNCQNSVEVVVKRWERPSSSLSWTSWEVPFSSFCFCQFWTWFLSRYVKNVPSCDLQNVPTMVMFMWCFLILCSWFTVSIFKSYKFHIRHDQKNSWRFAGHVVMSFATRISPSLRNSTGSTWVTTSWATCQGDNW